MSLQVEHGWVPSTILEPLPPEVISGDEDIEPRDETDFDTKNRRYTTAFGNQDLMTHQVIHVHVCVHVFTCTLVHVHVCLYVCVYVYVHVMYMYM